MRKLLLYIILTIPLQSFSQTILWEKIIDYDPSYEGVGSVIRDSDTTFVFCGGGLNINDYYAKANLDGDTLWKKINNENLCLSTVDIQHSDNGNLIHFGSKGVSGICNFFFQKMDSDGNVLSSWNYGSNYKDNFLEGGLILADGGYLGSGITKTKSNGNSGNYHLSLMRLDSSGNKLWHKIYRDDAGTVSVLVNRKGNYVVYGIAGDWYPVYKTYHPYLLEVTPDGDTVQSKYVVVKSAISNETISGLDDMIQTSNGDYLMVVNLDSTLTRLGNIEGINTGVVLLDSLFNVKWKLDLKPSGTQWYHTSTLFELKDSSYIILLNNLKPENADFNLIKISNMGQVLNQKVFTNTRCNKIILNDMALMRDSSLIVSGHCDEINGDGYLARISGIGLKAIADTCKTFTASFTALQKSDKLTLTNTSNGGYAYAWKSDWKFSDSTSSSQFKGKFTIPGDVDTVWARLIATNPYGCKDTLAMKIKVKKIVTDTTPAGEELEVYIYPNPFSEFTSFKISGNSSAYFKFKLYNNLGQEVMSREFKTNEFSIFKNDLSSGLYHYFLTDSEGRRSGGKLVVE